MNKKILMLIVMLIMILVPSYKVNAQTLQDLYDELEELKEKQKIAEGNKNITTEQIDRYNKEINNVYASIDQTKKDIETATETIVISEKEINEKKDETDQLLKFLQVSSGENVYLEYIFKADSYTDLIYRYSIVSQLTDHNNTLMMELETLITELEESKIMLAEKQEDLEKQSKELASKIATLKSNLKELNEEGTTIAEDIEAKQQDIDYYESKGCKRNEKLSSCVYVPSASGWKLPIYGGWVTSEYQIVRTDCYGCGGYSHRGIDIGASEGTPIYAAATGRVAYIVSRSSCGGNMVYVYHTVNNRPYTTVYMHLLTINVKTDDIVTTNTVIGTSGGYSTSGMPLSQCSISFVGRGGYDRCTCGGHLHFGVATGNDVSTFNANSFDPRQLAPFAYGSYLTRY